MRSRSVFTLVSAVSLVGCEAIPELTFASVDASPDATESGDGSADASGIVDAQDAPASDVGTEAAPPGSACPTVPPPPGISSCCGSVACIDKQSGSCNCADCAQQNCGSNGKICCVDNQGNLGCKSKPSDCK
jgi:hypothetical protein